MAFLSPNSTTLRSSSWARMFGAVALVLSGAGCDVELIPEVVDDATRNTCEADADCGGGRCSQGMCRTSATQIPALLLEITPPVGSPAPAQSPAIGGIGFTSVINEFDWGPTGYEIELPHVSLVTGTVVVSSLPAANCLEPSEEDPPTDSAAATNGSIPARITLTPRARLLGLPNPSFTGQDDNAGNVPGQPGETAYQVVLNVPPGQYDIYAEPASSFDGCVRPPFLVLDQTLESGNVNLRLELPPPERLGVTIRYPRATNDLKDWVLDIVQKDTGRLLSNRAALGEPSETDDGLEYHVDLAFSLVEGETGGKATELVRLSPPEGVAAPTIYLERSIVDLFQDGNGLIDQLSDISDVVTYRGRVTRSAVAEPVPSAVTLVALELASTNPGTVAAYSRLVETDDNGYFETQLLPGVYRVLAEPQNSAYARRIVEVIVSDAASMQTGRNIEVSYRHVMSGRVVSFSDRAVGGAPLVAAAVPSTQNINILQIAQGQLQPSPVAVSDVTQNDGSFEILADTGVFHVSVRPEASTGFAWGVRLGVDVAGSDSLGRIELPLPVVVNGRLTSQDLGDVVPSALIRAYALLADGVPVASEAEARSVVAVAETRVDESGQFRLLLPSAFK